MRILTQLLILVILEAIFKLEPSNLVQVKHSSTGSLSDLQCVVGLTHWGRVTHTCVGKLTIIGSDDGLSPGRRQAIIWTNAGIFLFGPLGSNFREVLIEIDIFSFKKMHLKLSSAKWGSFCLSLNVWRERTGRETVYSINSLPNGEARPHSVSLSAQSLYCSGPGHSQQGVLSAHCSRQSLIAPLITCS